MTTATVDQDQRLLLNVQDVSRRTSISVRSLWRMVSAGTFPAPVRVGRSTRWRADDVREWAKNLN